MLRRLRLYITLDRSQVQGFVKIEVRLFRHHDVAFVYIVFHLLHYFAPIPRIQSKQDRPVQLQWNPFDQLQVNNITLESHVLRAIWKDAKYSVNYSGLLAGDKGKHAPQNSVMCEMMFLKRLLSTGSKVVEESFFKNKKIGCYLSII